MSKYDAINIMNNSSLINKMGVLYKKNIFFSLYLNISGSTDLPYYQKDRNVILNKAKDYYNKERLKKPARDKCIDLSEEERNKKKRIWEE